jgi:hypothetical protein
MTNHQPATTRTLYVSDEAWAVLAQQAQIAGFVSNSEAPRGIGEYIEWLVRNCEFEDTRPDDVREQDDAMRSAGYAPEWRLYSPRRKRNVKLTADALALASVEALTLGMATYPVRRLIGAPTYIDDSACMSALLEALGTEWLHATIKERTETRDTAE